jgi:hypothetical protein
MPIRLTVPGSHILFSPDVVEIRVCQKPLSPVVANAYSVLALFRPWLSVLHEWPFSLLLVSEVKPPRVVAGYLSYNGLVHTGHVPVDDLVGIRPYGITVGIV